MKATKLICKDCSHARVCTLEADMIDLLVLLEDAADFDSSFSIKVSCEHFLAIQTLTKKSNFMKPYIGATDSSRLPIMKFDPTVTL